MTAKDIIKAWYSTKDVWVVRRNKGWTDGLQWEVVRDWSGTGGISENTQEVVRRFATPDKAEAYAQRADDLVRANAVLKLLERNEQLVEKRNV